MVSETVQFWLDKLGSNASEETLLKELEEAQDAISNENLWLLGSNTREAQLCHGNNIALLNEYIDILKTMLKIS